MKIRKARKKDLKEIAKIFREESAKKPYNTKYSLASALKGVLEMFECDLYVAMDEKKIAGFVASHIIRSTKMKAYIDELWIKDNYQGSGIGKMLMGFIENTYARKGLRGILLVARKKAGAYNFYKKLKYREPGEMVFMEKKL